VGVYNAVNPSGYHSFGKNHKEKVWNFAAFIKDFGWTGNWWEDEETEMVHLKATRGDVERIDVEYPVNQGWPDVFYTLAGGTIKCRNISQAAKLAQEKPDVDKMRAASRRLRNGKATASPPQAAQGPAIATVGADLIPELTGSLPFDKESTADEVKQALVKHKNPVITWVNKVSGQVDSAMIKTKSKQFKVTESKDGKVIINFSTDRGFRAVYANSIIGVS
jgi:hypothetical protein